MGQFTIDTLNKTDRDNAMFALHAIALNNGEDPLFFPIGVYNDQVSKLEALNNDLKKCNEENEIFKEELKDVNNKNETLFTANKNLRENIEDLERKYNELITENNILKDKLSRYTVGYGPDGNSKTLYFKPEDNKLVETTQNNAYFKGGANGDIIEFVFNDEKGDHQRAIQSRNNVLMPFCEIISSASEANYVDNHDKGEFSIKNGEFKLLKKAKISLVIK